MAVVNYEELLERALIMARQVRAEQSDTTTDVVSLARVEAIIEKLDAAEDKVVAILYDAVVSTNLTADSLISQGFPVEIIEAIGSITEVEDESYEEYLERVMCNPIGLRVKIADVSHALDLSRNSGPTEADYRRIEKDEIILKRLQAAIDWHHGRTAY